MFSLYGDLPAPKTKSDAEGDQSTNQDNTSGSGDTPSTTASPSMKSTPTGWSNMQQFRPVMRKPTIQAKPKLFKPMIPAGATIVSTTTVNEDDSNVNATPYSSVPASKATTHHPSSAPNAIPPTTIRPLHTKSYTSTQDDVNGFRQNKKKGKQTALQNQGPPPIDLTEDYDPLRPTDYEQYKEEIEIIRQQEQRQYHQERRSLSRRSSYSSDESSRSRSPSPRRLKNLYAPPPDLYNTSSSSSSEQQRHENQHLSRSPPSSRNRHTSSPSQRHSEHSGSSPPHQTSSSGHNNVYITESGDDAYNRRAMLSQQQPTRTMEMDSHQPTPMPLGSGENMAWKMMNKYGWQEGQGLGRSEDGIREALQVQARGDGSGIILPQRAAPSTQQQPQQQRQRQQHQQRQSPIVSPVIVLKNMVGPGEVDDLLQQETADECQKYGHVEQCLIYEVPDGRVKDEEAVRIFVKFSHLQSAINAIGDMNGRYFGGRVVSAETYDQDRFDKLDLAALV